MVGKLRSGKHIRSTDMDDTILVSKIDELLQPLQKNIEVINETLKNIRHFFENKLKVQGNQIKTLQIRLLQLESRVAINEHVSLLTIRKADDSEQFSRKLNLRLSGIEVGQNDSPANILEYIQGQATEHNIHIEKFEYDRCHRVGRKYRNRGKEFQDVLLKLCFWKSRDKFYQNRKKFSFKVSADLTPRRNEILKYAVDEIRDYEATSRNVKFVFADLNCNLKICSTSNNFFTFNSKCEFLNIVGRLDNEALCSPECLDDMDNGKPGENFPYDLYY